MPREEKERGQKKKNSKTLNKKSLVDFSSVEEDLFRVEKTDKNTTRNDFCLSSINTNKKITTKTTMKTNATISSSIIALLMMMLFSHASHAATIIQQNGTVSQLTPVFRDSDPVEYYAEALADVETLVRFFLYLFSLSFSLFSRRNERRGQGEMRKSALQSREARASRVGGRYNRQSSRASFSRLSMDDVDDGFVRNSKFRAGK